MLSFVNAANRFFSGPVMLWGVLAVGALLTVKTGFIQFRRLPYALRYAFSKMFEKPKKGQKGITPFQAVTTALSGTLGTGNIAGVGAALSIGGPGALFWMWVGAFLGMAIKYSEIVLAMCTRKKDKDGYHGGAMYYLQKLAGGKMLAFLFCIFCIGASFCMGNMAQSNTAAAALRAVFPISDGGCRFLFLLITILVGFVILGGIKRIAKTTEALVPAMAVFYLLGCFVVIGMNLQSVPAIFFEIFSAAFSFRSMAGGAVGMTMIHAMKVGFTRGVFTNEAGLGSAPIAHAAAENPTPAKQGLWGIFEVFFDTIVMCTLTGLVVLLAGLPLNSSSDGAAVTLAAFEVSLGGFASVLIGISTLFFAVATIIGWSFYGESCVRYLCRRKRAVFLYKLCYVAAVYIGAVSSIELIWGLSDLFNSLMMLVNLLGVACLCNVIREETRGLFRMVSKEKKSKPAKIKQKRRI